MCESFNNHSVTLVHEQKPMGSETHKYIQLDPYRYPRSLPTKSRCKKNNMRRGNFMHCHSDPKTSSDECPRDRTSPGGVIHI